MIKGVFLIDTLTPLTPQGGFMRPVDPFKEIPAIKVGKYLLEKGFIPASDKGKPKKIISDSPALGILWENPEAKSRKICFDIIKKRPKREFWGVIYFDKEELEAYRESHWVFEIYGRKYLPTAKRMGMDISSLCNVDISFRFIKEKPALEGRPPTDI